jgi:hypothetical protein
MTSHGSSDDGNALTHTDGLAREGFPRILWEVLQGAGYATPPQYAVQQFEKHRVPRCRVRMTLEPHPLQPGWRSLDSESFGYRAEDTIEAIALHGSPTGTTWSRPSLETSKVRMCALGTHGISEAAASSQGNPCESTSDGFQSSAPSCPTSPTRTSSGRSSPAPPAET